MVDVLPTGKWNPSQALYEALNEADEMEHVAIVYMRRGDIVPRLTCSSMLPVDMNFLGTALQHYSMSFFEGNAEDD